MAEITKMEKTIELLVETFSKTSSFTRFLYIWRVFITILVISTTISVYWSWSGSVTRRIDEAQSAVLAANAPKGYDSAYRGYVRDSLYWDWLHCTRADFSRKSAERLHVKAPILGFEIFYWDIFFVLPLIYSIMLFAYFFYMRREWRLIQILNNAFERLLKSHKGSANDKDTKHCIEDSLRYIHYGVTQNRIYSTMQNLKKKDKENSERSDERMGERKDRNPLIAFAKKIFDWHEVVVLALIVIVDFISTIHNSSHHFAVLDRWDIGIRYFIAVLGVVYLIMQQRIIERIDKDAKDITDRQEKQLQEYGLDWDSDE